MTNYPEILKQILIRLAIATPFVAAGFAMSDTGFASTACLLTACVIMASPLSQLFAESSGALFYPGDKFSRKQPMYSIPAARRAAGLYEDAISEYERIAKDNPNEVKPYIEMIDIAILNLKDQERAKEIYIHGMTAIKKKSDQRVLTQMYSAIRTRLYAKPSN